MEILVTGGLGFIGSHTVVELLENGYQVVVIDNLYNSKLEVKDKIKAITNKEFSFYQEDCCDLNALDRIFQKHQITAVIHFAGYKAVGESVNKPLKYYQNNLTSTTNLLAVMEKYNCNNFVFSSSATVYGDSKIVPVEESFAVSATNPYGYTKLFCEQILNDYAKANSSFHVAILRYFNPIGAHSSGIIGEEPNDIPNNLMPYIVKVANGQLECLSVFGSDYDTIDGSGVRDYIHVVDLAIGHLKALEYLNQKEKSITVNLGTGNGYSVLEVINTFEKVNKVKVNHKIVGRRPGDVAKLYAKTDLALQELGWKAEKNLEEMCQDSWNYILKLKNLK